MSTTQAPRAIDSISPFSLAIAAATAAPATHAANRKPNSSANIPLAYLPRPLRSSENAGCFVKKTATWAATAMTVKPGNSAEASKLAGIGTGVTAKLFGSQKKETIRKVVNVTAPEAAKVAGPGNFSKI